MVSCALGDEGLFGEGHLPDHVQAPGADWLDVATAIWSSASGPLFAAQAEIRQRWGVGEGERAQRRRTDDPRLE